MEKINEKTLIENIQEFFRKAEEALKDGSVKNPTSQTWGMQDGSPASPHVVVGVLEHAGIPYVINVGNTQHFNTAVTLYFKTIAVLVDLFLLKKEGFIPSNHSQRFRILEEKYSSLYFILDKDFPLYQQSYKLKLGKDYAEALKDDFKKVIEFTQIKID